MRDDKDPYFFYTDIFSFTRPAQSPKNLPRVIIRLYETHRRHYVAGATYSGLEIRRNRGVV